MDILNWITYDMDIRDIIEKVHPDVAPAAVERWNFEKLIHGIVEEVKRKGGSKNIYYNPKHPMLNKIVERLRSDGHKVDYWYESQSAMNPFNKSRSEYPEFRGISVVLSGGVITNDGMK